MSLSPRQLQVAARLATGATCQEIAADFGISVRTVDTHRGAVLDKLGLRNNAELALYAVRAGIVSMFDGDQEQP